jgi:DNA-binding transcriptional LysR family regulator
MVSRGETIEAAQLRNFVAVARRLSVTAASAALGVPKSRVSKALTALEARLGVRLLERSTRRVALTPAGGLLLARAESILAEIDRLVDDAREHTDAVRGVVRVTAPPELGALLAARFFPPLLAAHPGLELALELGYSFDDLLDPRFDLAFRLGSVYDDRLVARRLGAFRRVLVASPAYLRRHRVRAVGDLAARNCLAFSGVERKATWTLEPLHGAGAAQEVAVQGNFAAHGFAALLRAAAAGLGVARVPQFVAADAIARREVVRVLPEWAAPETEVFLVHRFGHDRIQRVRAVADAALGQVGALLAPAAPRRG